MTVMKVRQLSQLQTDNNSVLFDLYLCHLTIDLNGLHLRALGIKRNQFSFDVVCKCVEPNFKLNELIAGNSCEFKTEDAFEVLKKRPVFVICVKDM